MKSRSPSLVACALLLLHVLAIPTHSQEKSENPLVGKRARVHAPHFLDQPLSGIVTAYTPESLSILADADSREYQLDLKAISRYDPYKGGGRSQTAWFHARVWGFVGAGAAVMAAPFIHSDRYDAKTRVLMGVAAGGATGAALGATYGATFPRDRWGWVLSPWGYDPSLRP